MAGLLDILDDLALLIARAEKSVKDRTFDALMANDEVNFFASALVPQSPSLNSR